MNKLRSKLYSIENDLKNKRGIIVGRGVKAVLRDTSKYFKTVCRKTYIYLYEPFFARQGTEAVVRVTSNQTNS